MESEGSQESALEMLDMWKQEEKDFQPFRSFTCNNHALMSVPIPYISYEFNYMNSYEFNYVNSYEFN